jgi:hypothetical protein
MLQRLFGYAICLRMMAGMTIHHEEYAPPISFTEILQEFHSRAQSVGRQ